MAEIPEDLDPIVKIDRDRIVGLQWFGDAINGFFFLFLERAKHAVPNDERGPIITIEVLLLHAGRGEVVDGIGEWALERSRE